MLYEGTEALRVQSSSKSAKIGKFSENARGAPIAAENITATATAAQVIVRMGGSTAYTTTAMHDNECTLPPASPIARTMWKIPLVPVRPPELGRRPRW